MIELREFKDVQLLQILELCNKHMQFDHLSETILREKVVDDADFDPELVLSLWQDEQPVAFLAAVVRENEKGRTGYIKLLVVATENRRAGFGTKLFEEIEKRLLQKGISKLRVYDAPSNYFMPGIDPRYTAALSFFEENGFKRFGDTTNMTVDLDKQDLETGIAEEKLAKQKIEIARADYNDMQEILQFVGDYFPQWRSEVSNTYNSLPVSLHVARINGKIKALAAHNGNNFGSGWFGPLAIHADLDGFGVDVVLLKRCLQDMKDWGLALATIPWVESIRFYACQVNAQVQRVFWRYEKKYN